MIVFQRGFGLGGLFQGKNAGDVGVTSADRSAGAISASSAPFGWAM